MERHSSLFLTNMCGRRVSLFYFCCLSLLFCAFITTIHGLRNKRFLIFPRQAPTRYQFIGGIGIPADLTYESLTIGHVLKAEFFLPYNATVFRENPYLPEYKTDSSQLNLDNLSRLLQQPTQIRWHIYEYLENRLQSYGFKGRECLLKAICEANALHFARHFSVVAELLHLLLSPSTSGNSVVDDTRDYIEAEKVGIRQRSCDIYDCKLSLVSWISQVLHLDI